MKKAKSILALLMAFLMLMSVAVTGSAATVAEEKEPNNDKATASAFGFGTEIKGALGESTDNDWYSFTSDAAGLACVTMKHDEIADASKNLAYFEIVIYDAGLKQLTSFRSTGAEKTTASPSFAIDAGATYYVKVKMGTVHSEALEYSLIASFDKGAFTEKEPNNQSATATNLELSTKGNAKHYYGTIASTGNDVDFYRVAPSAKGVIYLYLYNGSSRSDFKATLYTHDETVDGRLREVPISSIEINSNEDSKTSVAIGVDAREYMLKVEGLNGKTGGYRTRVFFEAASDAEWEYNGIESEANTIAVGKSVRGTISQPSDVDFYKFKAVGEDNIGFDISLGSYDKNSKAEGSWYITVKDAATGAVVKETFKDEVKAGEPTVISTDALVAGRFYYVIVEKGGNYNSEIYKLSITAIEPEKDDNDTDELDFFEQIKVYWGMFWKNFEGWFEQINIPAIIESIAGSVATVFTMLFSAVG
ncbi:MAG: hypothetical protein IJE72_01390 [Clostridia bacterium]|nr:hypothetical protein [Clostridia bacterium]